MCGIGSGRGGGWSALCSRTYPSAYITVRFEQGNVCSGNPEDGREEMRGEVACLRLKTTLTAVWNPQTELQPVAMPGLYFSHWIAKMGECLLDGGGFARLYIYLQLEMTSSTRHLTLLTSVLVQDTMHSIVMIVMYLILTVIMTLTFVYDKTYPKMKILLQNTADT